MTGTIDITFLNWAVGIFSIIVSAMGVAFAKYHLDIREDKKIDREERKMYFEKLERLVESANKERELNTIATNGLMKAVDELRQDFREWRVK